MRLLVTGGTGVIGIATITELLRQGHEVRLLSRHADEDVGRWDGVEPFAADVTDAAALDRAAEGCDAVLHIAGIIAEEPPELTFARINVEGTRNVVDAAARASVKRFVFVSSLGAERGTSDYHASKRDAEAIVRSSDLSWTIVRPGGVYGPGDEVISLILRMVRSLPAVPVIDGGDQPFQPVWHEDLAKALAEVVRREDLDGQTLEIAGTEQTTLNDLLDRFAAITGREPARVPFPLAMAFVATSLASAAGIKVPIDKNLLLMLRDESVTSSNALDTLLGVAPTPLDRGLRALADELPEQTDADGVGGMSHKRYWADIANAPEASALVELVREQATTLMPVEFATEPGTAQRLDVGATLTGALPLRGNFQVRVESVEPNRIVLATLQGHPLAGSLQFSAEDRGAEVRFAVDTFTRAANVVDRIAMSTVGAPMQDLNWRRFVTNVVEASGGEAPLGVQTSSEKLSDEEAEEREKTLRELVQARQRDATTSS